MLKATFDVSYYKRGRFQSKQSTFSIGVLFILRIKVMECLIKTLLCNVYCKRVKTPQMLIYLLNSLFRKITFLPNYMNGKKTLFIFLLYSFFFILFHIRIYLPHFLQGQSGSEGEKELNRA